MSEADEKAREDKISPAAKEEALVPSKDEEKVKEGGDSPEAEEKMREGGVPPEAEEKANEGVAPLESQDELTTDYETDRPPTGLSDLSGMVADNEGSSPELAGGAQQEKGTGEEGGVEERREEWRRGKEGKEEREKTEAGVGTQEKPEAVTEEEQVDDEAKGQKEGDKREEEQETGEKEGGEEKAKVNAKGGEAVEEEERTISYNYDQMKSKPEVVNVTDGNLLELHHSFGYECQKRSNLVVLAKEVVAYAAGNLLVLLNLGSQEQVYRRSLGGGGIGAIAVHPSCGYFAVGEKGQQPVVAVYTYPDLRLHRVLQGGTEAVYSHLDFAPGEGRLMASVGGSPDFMLTVWDWERESIVLRSKAFSQDIYRVTFSPENPGQLTTSGTGHIRFWKMATTFTGLKLQGQLGKFGRTELTDIAAYVELPDGKVLSGAEWGNLLLWDGGFIKLEFSRKGKKSCHNGMIEAIYLDEGELISAGVDGFIRVWDFETIDNADITEENTTFEMDPLAEIKVGSDVSLKSLARSVVPGTPNLWYAQDAGGAIWKVDIVVSHTRKAPEKLVSFHSGEVVGLGCSPVALLAASIAQDGSVRVYDLPDHQLLCHNRFASGGSSLLWAPLTVDPSASTLLTGFQDGVLRVLQLEECKGGGGRHRRGPKYNLSLRRACKPHCSAVAGLAVDPEGAILASGGRDCTVFFLSIPDGYDPIGFIHTPAPVTTLQWSTGNKLCLLVCCEDGSMLEVEAPVRGEVNTSKSYHLNTLSYTCRTFSSIKDRLRREEEEARHAAELERKRREKDAAKQRRRDQLGEDYVSEEEEEEEEEEEDEGDEGRGEEEEMERPKGPSPILSAFYSSQDSREFWVSMGGYDAGYLYRCSMEGAGMERESYEPPHALPVPAFGGEDLPIHSLTFNSSGEYLLTGASNGCVRVHPLPQPHSITSLRSYWLLAMHDNHYGAVTHLTTTFDDSYVISAGADGNVFVYSANLPMTDKKAFTAGVVKTPSEFKESAKDIEDLDHYSIEDAKQKAEHDRKMRLAEEKKQRVMREVGALRRTFLRLQQRGRELPGHLRLGEREFVMDPNMEQQLRERAEAKVELVRREAVWEGEKHSMRLRKLQRRYKDIVECERVMVWTFRGREHVSSFRAVVPSGEYLQLMEKVLSSEQTQTPWTVAGQRTKRVCSMGGEGGEEGRMSGAESSPKAEATLEQLSKSEARRMKKERRKREWEELYRCRPDEKYEAPEDVEALRQSRELMGHYNLKTSSNFVVPENQRMSTERKRRQLLLLRNQIFERKREHNEKLLHLRDWKLEIVEKISSLVGQIEVLQAQLPPSLCKPVPSIPQPRPEEVPERRLEYTRESLLQFKSDWKAREAAERQAAAGVGEGFGGFGGFGGGGEENGNQQEVGEKDEKDVAASEERGEEEVVEGKVEEEGGGSGPNMLEEQKQEVLTPIQALRQEQQVLLVYERDSLLEEVEHLKSSFDEALLRLRHEKSHMEATIVAADLKHITQFEELQLLKEFEKRETVFTSRYRSKKQERQDMEGKMEEAQWSVSEKERQVARLQDQEKALHASFSEAIGENKFKDFLLKVFKKKIKRQKRKPEGEKVEGVGEDREGEESREESDSEYSSSSEEESESEAGDMDDSVCPLGCDPALFRQACELRERRLDLEELLAEERKALDSLRKELEGMKKKIRSMEAHVKNALNDLQAFQLKKQQRLNELDQVVVLRLHQLLYHCSGGSPPSSLAPCLVFAASMLLRLTERIGELSVEKQQEKRKYKELRQKHVRLLREKKEMQHTVAELERRVNEMMLLKFGQVVDLDRLEGLGTNRIVEELRGKLSALEHRTSQELAELEAQMDTERHRLVAVTRENTQRLNQLHELLTTQTQLEQKLNARQKSMGQEVAAGDLKPDGHEQRQLLQLVRLQAADIEALRAEIQLLSHKGGHILPPSQPPINTHAQPPPLRQ